MVWDGIYFYLAGNVVWIGWLTPVAPWDIETKTKANISVELRDSLEQLCSNYPAFLEKLWPVFKQILTGEPVFTSASFEQVKDKNLAEYVPIPAC